jgi:hypothetical protein
VLDGMGKDLSRVYRDETLNPIIATAGMSCVVFVILVTRVNLIQQKIYSIFEQEGQTETFE